MNGEQPRLDTVSDSGAGLSSVELRRLVRSVMYLQRDLEEGTGYPCHGGRDARHYGDTAISECTHPALTPRLTLHRDMQ